MLNFIRSILDWVYYKKCYFCGKGSPEGIICNLCYKKIQINPAKQYKSFNNVEIFSIANYKDDIQKLIRGIKFHNQKDFAPYAAKLLFDFWKETTYANKDFIIVPMPSHGKRLKQRKFNHIELIANEFSKLTGYAVNTKLIYRIKNTKPQYKLSKIQRLENLKNAFSVNIENYNGENILLLDDICTTGITMQEAIKALNKKGIDKLCGLVISNP